MYKKKTSAQLKQAARGIMIGKYRNAISILLASNLIISTLSLFTTSASNSTLGIIIGLIINFLITLFGTILTVGQCSFYLNVACNQTYQFSDLFTGFKIHPDKTIITQLIIQLLTALPLLPAIGVILYSFQAYNIIVVFLVGCILFILGVGISWWISLRYSQVYYLLLDFPDYSAKELLRMSRELMKGNVGRLLYIQVSFIPLTLVGLLSFGVGLLLVQPYQNMTYTLFYLDLMQSNN
ncbi:MAG: DUF975 family protein [Lachnospiraceae bacterium]|nr:DUF975 family protein [Lachnospiraceae bacterium]